MRGGKRPGAGRKPDAEPKEQVKIMATPDEIDYLRSLGDGVAARGLRRLLDQARDRPTQAGLFTTSEDIQPAQRQTQGGTVCPRCVRTNQGRALPGCPLCGERP